MSKNVNKTQGRATNKAKQPRRGSAQRGQIIEFRQQHFTIIDGGSEHINHVLRRAQPPSPDQLDRMDGQADEATDGQTVTTQHTITLGPNRPSQRITPTPPQ